MVCVGFRIFYGDDSWYQYILINRGTVYKIKVKVARCMSLLISHFDIMGARSSEAEKNKLLKWTAQRHNIASSQNDDEYLNKVYHEEVMGQIKN